MELGQDEVLEDILIDGLKIIQNKNLYRFSSDAVLLSKFASSKKGEVVADFCSGSGIVGIHYYALHKESVRSVDFFELQTPLADMCERTLEYNGLNGVMHSHNIKVQDIPIEYNGKFSLVLCNPPYKKKNSGINSEEMHIAVCRHEIEITLDEIISVAHRTLKEGGRLCICQRTDRLTDLLYSMRQNKIEPSQMCFVASGDGKKPYLVLVEGVKGVKPQLKIQPQIIN